MKRLRLLCLLPLLSLTFTACSKKEQPEPVKEKPAASPSVEQVAPPPVASAPQTATVEAKPAPSTPPAPALTKVEQLEQQGPERARQVGLDPVSRARPVYPHEFIAQKKEGEVVADLLVNPDGSVSSVTIVSSTDPLFTEAAEKALLEWRFTPRDASDVARVRQRIPFLVERPLVGEFIEDGEDYPVLGGILRPPHPGAPGRAVARLTLDRTAVVKQVEIVESEGSVDPQMIQLALREWVFMGFFKDGEYKPAEVLVEVRYAPGGSVLIQYPYE